MKIIVLGGAGDMGSRTVEELAVTDGVELVTIADRDAAGAERRARRLAGSPAKVDVKIVDAGDHAGLVRALAGYDVAASALGPFHRFESPLVRAAVEAGVDYMSICDEWQAVEEVLHRHQAAARAAGRIVITGMGASPGLTNIGIRYLASRWEQLQGVDIACYMPFDSGGGEAVLKHLGYVMTGQVALWRDGRQLLLPACSERRTVEFPRFGPIKLWNMGHSEPYTVPRYFPGLAEVSFFMGCGPGTTLLVEAARRGLFAEPRRLDRLARGATWLEQLTPTGAPGLGALRLDAWGRAGGRPVRRMICGVGEMREVTGLSLAIGAVMLGRRQLLSPEPGIFAPEACIEPEPFIAALRAKGVVCYEDLALSQPLDTAA